MTALVSNRNVLSFQGPLSECHLTSTSLAVPETFTEDQCLAVVMQLQSMDKCIRWWLGDAIAAADKRHGAAKKAAQLAGMTHGSARNCSSLSEKFEVSRRRDSLSWSHHQEVAAKPPAEQEKWLDYAEEQQLSRQALRDAIKEADAAIPVEAGEAEEDLRLPEFSPLIKPSDNWNFAKVEYGRIDEDGESHGYIPGEIYANCFWYYAPNAGEVCDLMAGSGQAQRVYEDRERWGRGEDVNFNLRLFDRFPRGRYKDQIEQLDATKGLPEGYHPDYIFMDVPYFGQVVGAYSDAEEDIANMDLVGWSEAMQAVAASCAAAQAPDGLCSVMAPNFCDWESGRIMTCDLIRQWWTAAGYALHDIAYSTRRIQQAQNPAMAKTNIKAKRERLMLSDIAEIQTFRRAQ
jgi:hypothetical protein